MAGRGYERSFNIALCSDSKSETALISSLSSMILPTEYWVRSTTLASQNLSEEELPENIDDFKYSANFGLTSFNDFSKQIDAVSLFGE